VIDFDETIASLSSPSGLGLLASCFRPPDFIFLKRLNRIPHEPSCAFKKCSASMAAMQPEPAAVIACRYT
jgi:hypothetical protein